MKSFVARVVFESEEDDPTRTLLKALSADELEEGEERPTIVIETAEVTPYERPGLFTILCEGRPSVTFRGRWSDAQATARELYSGVPFEIVELQV